MGTLRHIYRVEVEMCTQPAVTQREDRIGQTDEDEELSFMCNIGYLSEYLSLDAEVTRFIMWCLDTQGKRTKVQGEDRWYLGRVWDC